MSYEESKMRNEKTKNVPGRVSGTLWKDFHRTNASPIARFRQWMYESPINYAAAFVVAGFILFLVYLGWTINSHLDGWIIVSESFGEKMFGM
jgi:hypothetical protein